MSLWSVAEVITAVKLNQKNLYIGETAPASPTDGQLWYDTTNNVLKQYDGDNSIWVLVSLQTTVASDTLKHSNDAEKSTFSTTYVKLKEVLLNAPVQKIRIKFDLLNGVCAGFFAYARIYKNGVPIGTEQHVGTCTWITHSEDFSGPFAKGDKIQLYGKVENAQEECAVRNMRFYFDIFSFTNQDPA